MNMELFLCFPTQVWIMAGFFLFTEGGVNLDGDGSMTGVPSPLRWTKSMASSSAELDSWRERSWSSLGLVIPESVLGVFDLLKYSSKSRPELATVNSVTLKSASPKVVLLCPDELYPLKRTKTHYPFRKFHPQTKKTGRRPVYVASNYWNLEVAVLWTYLQCWKISRDGIKH